METGENCSKASRTEPGGKGAKVRSLLPPKAPEFWVGILTVLLGFNMLNYT